MIDVTQTILDFNNQRDPERLAMKYQLMRVSPFVFLRGTCHLFYQRLPISSIFKTAPLTWVCGDMHLENFGSYKGGNRLAYFDMNDFDEAALAPLTWEIVRLLTSILIGAESLSISQEEATILCQRFIDVYAATLTHGKATWIERETSHGIIRHLLDELSQRDRASFLDRRTIRKGKKRHIRIDGKKALQASDFQRTTVTELINNFAATQPNPAFYKVIDVARRIAGTGSLGVDRYVILVHGKGSPDGNYLLDLKNAMPSTVASNCRIKQPKWASEAHRVVEIQYRMQAVSMAFLTPVLLKHRDQYSGYILRALQPMEDRISLNRTEHSFAEIEKTMDALATIVASGQLRSAGRDGSAIADELITYSKKKKWKSKLLTAAQDCAKQVQTDWETYCVAFDEGKFDLT